MPMAGSMIVVDTNAGESALYEALVRRFDGSTVQRRKLDVGDVMLVAEAGTVYVERKTWLDWAKSMTDGRYASQKARLRSLLAAPAEEEQEEEEEGGGGGGGNAVAVLYLVEGALTGWSGKVLGGRGGGGGQPAAMGQLARMTNAQLEAAVVMTAVRDGVPVLRSKDGAHSLELLVYLFDKLRAGELLQSSGGGAAAAASSSSGYAGLVVKKRPRDNMTPATTWEVMLAQVPGMSAHKAAVVAAAYPTMSALSAAPQEQLANVLVPPASPSRTASSGGGGGGGAAKKPRRLGPKVAERLAQL
jgi:hypothetical protein